MQHVLGFLHSHIRIVNIFLAFYTLNYDGLWIACSRTMLLYMKNITEIHFFSIILIEVYSGFMEKASTWDSLALLYFAALKVSTNIHYTNYCTNTNASALQSQWKIPYNNLIDLGGIYRIGEDYRKHIIFCSFSICFCYLLAKQSQHRGLTPLLCYQASWHTSTWMHDPRSQQSYLLPCHMNMGGCITLASGTWSQWCHYSLPMHHQVENWVTTAQLNLSESRTGTEKQVIVIPSPKTSLELVQDFCPMWGWDQQLKVPAPGLHWGQFNNSVQIQS